jgi:hypothetical protein
MVPPPGSVKPMPGKTPEKVPAPKAPKTTQLNDSDVVLAQPVDAQVAGTPEVQYFTAAPIQERPRFRLFAR